ncbi:hypothetical protein XA68_15743 [Ophiocordyceps unilateralis]|uniref:Carboxylic ester hydrolase n=1 Tax=Ophiocordyceps unilateralis TaxID=268505 RepID=A0A2A9P7T0_OPHUN|nr:hypothetical protein XA68_15743 [Ophiocordyceps unilateralis]
MVFSILGPVLSSLFLSAVLAVPSAESVSGPVTESGTGTRTGTGPDSILQPPWKTVDVLLGSGLQLTGRSSDGVESFNGVPYADPPVGPLRLKPPRPFSGQLGRRDATQAAAVCPQMLLSSSAKSRIMKFAGKILDSPFLEEFRGQEDCLTLNVQRPVGAKAGDKLPVLFWIWGGAFAFGGSVMYDATSLLTMAMEQRQDFVFVAINHRLGGFGFLPGKEVLADGSANLGLLDQRLALEWVADNIEAFGGDPDKVTIWGLSSGAISVFDQMILYGGNATYKGKSLFRGAIINSGGAAPADRVDGVKGQAIYDAVAHSAGCFNATDSLECLRRLEYPLLLNAMNSVPAFFSYSSIALSYLPRPDGVVLPDSPERLVQAGRLHAVPIIIGNQEDEGTTVALFQWNLTTADHLAGYLSNVLFPSFPVAKLKQYVHLYDPALLQGSPHRTGLLNELYPGYKRVAAVLGDLTFTLSRRILLLALERVKPQMPVWSYIASYNHALPILGTFHASDVFQIFFGLPSNYAARSCRTYYLNFLHNLDPNKGVVRYGFWPRWNSVRRDLMWFRWPWANDAMRDDFRSGAEAWLEENANSLHM